MIIRINFILYLGTNSVHEAGTWKVNEINFRQKLDTMRYFDKCVANTGALSHRGKLRGPGNPYYGSFKLLFFSQIKCGLFLYDKL